MVARNIEWFHKDYENEDLAHFSAYVKSNLQRMLYEYLLEGESLAKAATFCDEKLGLPVGTSLAYFKHLLARKYWVVDMNVKINPSLPVNHLQIVNMNETLREQGGS
nr:TnsA endonuclease C-terminal domain-containing protein [Brevibacillus laterosporus]